MHMHRVFPQGYGPDDRGSKFFRNVGQYETTLCNISEDSNFRSIIFHFVTTMILLTMPKLAEVL
jgi:hypothetical protein